MEFVLHQPISLEESLTCEFKEVKSQPLQAIGKKIDEYIVAFLNESGGSIYWGIRDADRVVTGVSVTDKVRDELRQVIGQKVAAIAPPVPAALVDVPFHPVQAATGGVLSDRWVVEVRVTKPDSPTLFLTGGGEAYKKTLGGTKKLSGAELFLALAVPLQAKLEASKGPSVLVAIPSVHRRAMLVQSITRRRRVLWVDDNPAHNFYERLALTEMGLAVDLAVTSEEALKSAQHFSPDVIISDIRRGGESDAGLRFLHAVRSRGMNVPVIFYIGWVDEDRGTPRGAFAITDRPDGVLHFVLDVLERMGD